MLGYNGWPHIHCLYISFGNIANYSPIWREKQRPKEKRLFIFCTRQLKEKSYKIVQSIYVVVNNHHRESMIIIIIIIVHGGQRVMNAMLMLLLRPGRWCCCLCSSWLTSSSALPQDICVTHTALAQRTRYNNGYSLYQSLFINSALDNRAALHACPTKHSRHTHTQHIQRWYSPHVFVVVIFHYNARKSYIYFAVSRLNIFCLSCFTDRMSRMRMHSYTHSDRQ